MSDIQTTLYWALACAGALAVLCAGIPVRRPAPTASTWPAIVVAHDIRLARIVGAVVGIASAAYMLDAFDGAWAWLLLAGVIAVGAPVALDRWQRTNGDRAPLPLLRTAAEAASSAAPHTDEAVEKLRDRLGDVPPGLLAELRASTDDCARRNMVVERLAGEALRSDRDGEPIWLTEGPDDVTRRSALRALAYAHAETSDRALA